MTVHREAARVASTSGGARLDAGSDNSHIEYTTVRQGPLHGTVRGDVWHKRVRASAHMLRTPPGWAVDAADLDAAERAGARFVCITDSEKRRTFWARLDVLRAVGVPVRRGFGEQVALPLNRWAASRAGAEALELKPEPEAAGAVQMGLWGGER